jgi:prepilin-type N-terminal cleavage/methylation domain-containing protein
MDVKQKVLRRKSGGDRGFSLVEVMVALTVMVIGIVGLLVAFAASVVTLQQSREDSLARQEAQAFLEGIFAARNTGAITFSQIQNQSQDPVNGVFKDGLVNAYQAGPDGLMNTNDDLAAIEIGPDGNQLQIQRQIQITPVFFAGTANVDPNVRQVKITINYGVGKSARSYVQTTFISTYR